MHAWANIRLLLWVYERSFINGFILGEMKSRWMHIGSYVSRIVAFVGFYLFFRYLIFASIDYGGHFGASDPSQVLGSMINVLGVVLLLGAIKFAYQVFYLSADLEWLLSSPLPISRVFISKFIENAFYGGHIVFSFGWPAVLAYGAYQSAPFYYYPAALLLTAGLTVYSGAIGLLICLPLMRYVSTKRLRDLLLTLSMMLSIGIFMLFRQIGTPGPGNKSAFQPEWLPTTHLTRLLNSAASDGWSNSALSLAAFLVPAVLLGVLAYYVSLKLYISGLQRKTEEEGKIRASGGEGLLYRISRGLKPDIRSIMLKDSLETIRNPRQWFYLVFAIIFLGVQLFGESYGSIPMMYLFFLLFISSIFSQELTVLGFAREAEMFGIVAASGIPAWRLYVSKWVTAFVPTIIFAISATIISGLIRGMPSGEIVLGVVIVSLGVCTIVSYSLLIGALYPDFKAHRTRRRISPWALLLNMFFTVVLIFLVILPMILGTDGFASNIPAYISILPIYFSASIMVLMMSISFMVASKRLKRLLNDVPV